ncbi:adenylate/guanylate cyclase domain-containing protein [Agrobacterium sp.]|jgi:adenylate cyclase|uniref:adenylate/guanylate cyclase domain-containing protein n=1 Tax=Agrobacterium sp. TaxID=361 RepID=UPI0028AD04A1
MTDNAQNSASSNSNGLLTIIEWLSGDECNGVDDIGLVAQLGKKLHQLGIPVDRLTLHMTTLHPDLVGRTIAWAPREPIEIHERDRTGWAHFAGSPITRVMKSRDVLVLSANDDNRDHWQHIDIFAGRSLNQLIVAPMCNADGPVSVVAFGTRKAAGFTIGEQQMLLRILPALRTASELRVLRQAELSLLDTYIGPMTAQRILAGRIRQGEVETIEAALLLCDLRGFTELSNNLDATSVLDILNGYFEKVIPVITGNGGEVLKFMGDAVLAFFPGHSAASSCEAALQSASAIIKDLASSQLHGLLVGVGIALHYGEVSYGNIGSGRRMDFTMIGPDVNMVSRIQSVSSELKLPLLMSERFENAVATDTKSVGHYSLKGFPGMAELFTSHSA